MYNNRTKEIEQEIKELEYVSKICIDLLEFKGSSKSKKEKLINCVNQVVGPKNYNKVKTIEKISGEALDTYTITKDVKSIIEKRCFERDLVDKIYRKYFIGVHDVKDIRKTLLISINEIQQNQSLLNSYKDIEKIKLEKKDQEGQKITSEIYNGYTPTSNYSYGTKSTPSIPVEEIKDTKEVQKRLSFDYQLENKDVEAIMNKYELTNLDYSSGFVSESSVKKVVGLYDVQIGLNKKYKIDTIQLATAFNDIYKLAVQEAILGAASMNGKLDKMRRLVSSYGGYDFVERYYKMYTDLEKYIESLPDDEREAYKQDLAKHLNSNLKMGSYVIDPEEFRTRVNEDIANHMLMDSQNIRKENLYHLSRQTKYMNAEDIANLYHRLDTRSQYTTHEMQKEACVELIVHKMPPVSSEDPKFHEIMDTRRKAVLKDYFSERGLDSSIKEGQAKELVAQKELVEQKKKEYFRMSKFKKALASMSYKKLVRLSEKKELTDKEENELRRMF